MTRLAIGHLMAVRARPNDSGGGGDDDSDEAGHPSIATEMVGHP